MGAGNSILNVPKLSSLIQDEIKLLQQKQEDGSEFEWTDQNISVWESLHRIMDKDYARTDFISLTDLATICINLEADQGIPIDKMVFYRKLCRIYRSHKNWAYHWIQNPDLASIYEHSVQAVEVLICLSEMSKPS